MAEALQAADPLAPITALIGPRTKLVALSHVLWANGRVLPMRAISDAAHAVGAPVLADGAQGAGAIDVDPAALGVDAYAGPGQKWLCGPNGVGFLWVAEGFEDSFEVAAPSYYTRDFRSEGQPFWPGARRHDGASLTTGGARRARRGGVVPARARGLVGGRRADGRRARALRRSCCRRCRA